MPWTESPARRHADGHDGRRVEVGGALREAQRTLEDARARLLRARRDGTLVDDPLSGLPLG